MVLPTSVLFLYGADFAERGRVVTILGCWRLRAVLDEMRCFLCLLAALFPKRDGIFALAALSAC